MKKLFGAAAALAAVMAFTPAMADITHEDAGNSFRTSRGVGSAPVGRLTVSSSQTISSFGVDVDLNGDSTLKFLIFDSSSGAILYQSAEKAFSDTGGGYKFSDALSFTFNPGTVYGLTASSSTGGQYFVDFTPNSVGAFSFLTGNQNISNYANPVLSTFQNCCDVGTALVLGEQTPGVPEPASWALIIAGFGAVGATMRRKSAAVSFA